MSEKKSKDQPINLIFVCTHNSRRSHISQLWAQAAAVHMGVENVQTFSGGTETTAFNPRPITALETHGFVINDTGERTDNRIYEVSIGDGFKTIRSFSKKYSHPDNPTEQFAAVMVCSDADTKCPYVKGAETRVAMPYIDPKRSDNTPEEAATYVAKSEEIGREMLWLMSLVQ